MGFLYIEGGEMIKHIVLLNFAPGIDDHKIKRALDRLGNLRHHEIPQIMSYTFGKNCSMEQLDHGFKYGFIMEFANDKDRDIYLNHQLHRQIAKHEILPLLSNGVNSVIVLDYVV